MLCIPVLEYSCAFFVCSCTFLYWIFSCFVQLLYGCPLLPTVYIVLYVIYVNKLGHSVCKFALDPACTLASITGLGTSKAEPNVGGKWWVPSLQAVQSTSFLLKYQDSFPQAVPGPLKFSWL